MSVATRAPRNQVVPHSPQNAEVSSEPIPVSLETGETGWTAGVLMIADRLPRWRDEIDVSMWLTCPQIAPRSPVPSNGCALAERLVATVKRLIDSDLSSAPTEYQVIQTNLRYALDRFVIVDGEWCSWEEDEDLGVVVQRDPWSLLGTGETLQDAIDDFKKEAAEDALAMQHDKFEDLTEEAWRMRDCVMKYFPTDGY